MEYSEYINEGILDLYIDSLDTIIENTEESINIIDTILEAPIDPAASEKITTAASNVKAKLVELFGKLKDLFKRFGEAIVKIAGSMAEKIGHIKNAVAKKLQTMGNAVLDKDLAILKPEVSAKNVDETKKLLSDLFDSVIRPIASRQEAKVDELSTYKDRFEVINYDNVIKDDANLLYFKENEVVRLDILKNASNSIDNIAGDIKTAGAEQKKAESPLNTVAGSVGSDNNDQIKDDKLFMSAIKMEMQFIRNIIKFSTRRVGDIMQLLKHNVSAKAKQQNKK